MQLKKNIALSESGFIFNPSTGDSYSVNSTGYKILELLKEGLSEDAVKEELIKNFQVSKDQIEEDYYDFTSHLKQLDLLKDGSD